MEDGVVCESGVLGHCAYHSIISVVRYGVFEYFVACARRIEAYSLTVVEDVVSGENAVRGVLQVDSSNAV